MGQRVPRDAGFGGAGDGAVGLGVVVEVTEEGWRAATDKSREGSFEFYGLAR